MSLFVEMKTKAGSRMLLNLETVFGFIENADGTFNAVSVAGGSIEIAMTYKQLQAEMLQPEKPPGK